MPSLLKFLHSRDIGSIEQGTFIFRNSAEFRDWQPPIGDRTEAMTEVPVKEYLHHPRNGNRPLGPGVHFSKGSEFSRISGVNFVYLHPTTYVSCFAVGDFANLAALMMNKHPDRYDACVRVNDAERLYRLLWQSGIVRQKKTRLRKYTDGLQHGLVSYDKTPLSAPVTYKESAWSCFAKSAEYAFQREYRFALQTNSEELGSKFYVDCPEAAPFIERVA